MASDDNCSVSEQAFNNVCYTYDCNSDFSSEICNHKSSNLSNNSDNQQDEHSTTSCIPQLDGLNDSLPSSITSSDTSILSTSSYSSIPQTNDQFTPLPTIYSANGRSIFPKYIDLSEKLQNHRIDIAQISETWQDINKNEHNDKIDELENNFGYSWYSFARPKYKDTGSLTGGGGTAILVNKRNWSSQHLSDILVPQGLEIVWVKVTPKN